MKVPIPGSARQQDEFDEMPRHGLDHSSSDSDDELDLQDHSTLSRDRGRNAHRRPRAERAEGVVREQDMPQALKVSDVVSEFKNTTDHKQTTSDSEKPQSISDRLKCCMLDFKHMLDSTSLAKCTQEVPLDLWHEQYQRLQGWASNIGAYAQDASSLEYRLREASRILEHVDSLIRSIRADLADIENHVQHVGGGRDSGDAQSNSDSDSTTMVQELYTGIDSYITDLLKVSILIRNSTSYERIMQLDSDAVAETAPWFIRHVREKFPGCDTSVCERLGRAIARRRAEIEYRRKQSEKRKRGLARFLDEQDHSEENSQTPTKFTDFAKVIQQTESDSKTETTSYSDLDATNVDGDLSIPPPPPDSANGEPFDCPYCFNPTSIHRPKDWSRHVLHDALPYICVFGQCSTADKLYGSRREYFKHMRRAHYTALDSTTARLCLLCDHQVLSESFFVHLSHHLIQLALFSLQPYDIEVDDDLAKPIIDIEVDDALDDSEVDDELDDRKVDGELDDRKVDGELDDRKVDGELDDRKVDDALDDSEVDDESAESMGLMYYWMPEKGVDETVLMAYLKEYLDDTATVRESQHPKDREVKGFTISAKATVSVEGLRDIMKDSKSWVGETESREYRRDPYPYIESDTWRARKRTGPAPGHKNPLGRRRRAGTPG